LKYKRNGSYALVTGCTDGIGKEFVLQLAKKKFNILLVSRSQEKLEELKKEVEQMGVLTKTFAIDFSKATEKDFQSLEKVIKEFQVDVLVNNVAVSHNIPTPFQDILDTEIDTLIDVNCKTTLKITKYVLPRLIEKKSGLILNVGSFAGMIPTGYLQTYSGTKAFLKCWSEALSVEMKKYSIHVEHLNTYFVVTKMSQLKRTSFFIPSASGFVRSALGSVGNWSCSTPYPNHNWLNFLMHCVDREKVIDFIFKNMENTRKRALKKL
jgi:17beta-estradiol 17-dehydrogenase / very-long-chain 3-oxoacyl-CoA reductase